MNRLYTTAMLIFLSSGIYAQLLNENPGFESGSFLNEWKLSPQNTDDAIAEIVSGGNGNPSPRSGDYMLHIFHQSVAGSTHNRCEVVSDLDLGAVSGGTGVTGDVPWYEEQWMGMSVYLKDWGDIRNHANPSKWNGVLQYHGVPYDRQWSTCNTQPNGLSIAYNDGTNDYTQINFPHLAILTHQYTQAEAYGCPSGGAFSGIPVPPWYEHIDNLENKWLNFVFHYRISPGPHPTYNPAAPYGFMEVWVDIGGTGNYIKVVDLHNIRNMQYLDACCRTSYPADPVSLVTFGSYKRSSSTNPIDMYFDEIRFADSRGNFDLVSPGEAIQEEVNEAPILSAIGNKIVSAGSNLNVPMTAVDPEGDEMTYSVSPDLDFITLDDQGNGSGNLTISPEISDIGTYNLDVIITDDMGAYDSEMIIITVSEEDNTNNPPILTPIGKMSVEEEKVIKISLSAMDPDEDLMFYSITPQFDFIELDDHNDGTALLVIAPTSGDAGAYNIKVTVTDANNNLDSENIEITIMEKTNNNYVDVINSGGTSLALGSMLAREDRYFDGGEARTYNYASIEGTNDDELYQSLRFGEFSYNIPVPFKGLYTVKLHFAELAYLDNVSGQRVFNVDIENEQEKLEQYDIIADIGSSKAVVKIFKGIEVTDGKLTIDLASVKGDAIISGIEIISEMELITGLDSDLQARELLIYPNPSNGIFNLELPQGQTSRNEITYNIYNLEGKHIHTSVCEGQRTLIDISGQGPGMYIIQVDNYITEKIFLR